jgi:hypothetical protein
MSGYTNTIAITITMVLACLVFMPTCVMSAPSDRSVENLIHFCKDDMDQSSNNTMTCFSAFRSHKWCDVCEVGSNNILCYMCCLGVMDWWLGPENKMEHNYVQYTSADYLQYIRNNVTTPEAMKLVGKHIKTCSSTIGQLDIQPCYWCNATKDPCRNPLCLTSRDFQLSNVTMDNPPICTNLQRQMSGR